MEAGCEPDRQVPFFAVITSCDEAIEIAAEEGSAQKDAKITKIQSPEVNAGSFLAWILVPSDETPTLPETLLDS